MLNEKILEKIQSGEELTYGEKMGVSKLYEGYAAYLIFKPFVPLVYILAIGCAVGFGFGWVGENTEIGKKVTSQLESVLDSEFFKRMGEAAGAIGHSK